MIDTSNRCDTLWRAKDFLRRFSCAAGKRGPQPKIAQQLERIQALPAAEQRAIVKVLDSVLAAHQ